MRNDEEERFNEIEEEQCEAEAETSAELAEPIEPAVRAGAAGIPRAPPTRAPT